MKNSSHIFSIVFLSFSFLLLFGCKTTHVTLLGFIEKKYVAGAKISKEANIPQKELILISGNRIKGIITSDSNNGKPATVTLFGPDAFLRKIESDESGTFFFDNLIPAEYEVKIKKEGYKINIIHVLLTDKNKKTKNLTIKLTPFIYVNGYVCLSDSITPVSNAHIILQQGTIKKSTYTNASGYFEFTNIPKLDFSVSAFDIKSGKISTMTVNQKDEGPSNKINFYLQ